MEYKSVEQMARLARVEAEAAPALPPPLTQNQRLERWATILEENPSRRLNTFFETEYQLPTARDAMRPQGSPISVAFADPQLRADGLRDDSYGEAKRYFGLSDHQMHHVLCYCHYGATMSAGTAARALRSIVMAYTQPGLMARMRRLFA
jgi:hypothetical protein